MVSLDARRRSVVAWLNLRATPLGIDLTVALNLLEVLAGRNNDEREFLPIWFR